MIFGKRKVNNVIPASNVTAPYKLAIIGEAPGETEVKEGKPFVGASGRFLSDLLRDAGIRRELCFIGNICPYNPPGNDIKKFDWDGEEIQEGLADLRSQLKQYAPNLCLLLGGTALHAAKTSSPPSKTNSFPISAWRGSLFISDDPTSPFFGLKCMASFHPAYLQRMYSYTIITRFDLRRAAREATSPQLVLPHRNIQVQPDLPTILDRLDHISHHKTKVALDIEGTIDNMSCISFATGPTDVFIIPFTRASGEPYWGQEAEMLLWKKLARVLQDPEVPKILQNGLYDAMVLGYSYRIPVLGIVDDTMLKHWEYIPELEKSLGFQASIYTKEPYYKSDRKTQDQKTFWSYCCKDSAVTYEVSNVLDTLIKGPSKEHYAFNVQLLNPLLYMQLRGIRFDEAARRSLVAELQHEVDAIQHEVDEVAGRQLNVKSPKQMKEYLYEDLKLPIKRARPKRGEDQGAVTTNFEAVLQLAYKTGRPELYKIIKLRKARDHISHLGFSVDKDGRVRCSYNAVGTETGRLSCQGSVTGSGTNLQTISKKDRHLFLADKGHEFFEIDLAGADGWTVAAHCAALGDATMLEDLLFGLKIPKVLALMVRDGSHIASLSRQELKKLTETVDKSSDIYFSCKQCQHGTNYGMSSGQLSLRIFLKSMGEINISSKDAEKYQQLYLRRYQGIKKWHDWVMQRIAQGSITSASGNVRPILGRRNHETLKETLAHEPQNNTTYSINRAALNLWRDPTNRRDSGSLIVEPLHQVHDALCGQFPKDRLHSSIDSLKQWFDNPITIAGIQIRIPFEGSYGPNWRDSEGVF